MWIWGLREQSQAQYCSVGSTPPDRYADCEKAKGTSAVPSILYSRNCLFAHVFASHSIVGGALTCILLCAAPGLRCRCFQRVTAQYGRTKRAKRGSFHSSLCYVEVRLSGWHCGVIWCCFPFSTNTAGGTTSQQVQYVILLFLSSLALSSSLIFFMEKVQRYKNTFGLFQNRGVGLQAQRKRITFSLLPSQSDTIDSRHQMKERQEWLKMGGW